MRMFDVQGIEIRATFERVFRYVADPANLPRWTHAFAAADADRATLRTPNGEVVIALHTRVVAEAGTVDWELVFPDGTLGLAQSRVTPTSRGTVIYSFVLHAPPVALEALEGALEQQIATLRTELATLRALVEA